MANEVRVRFDAQDNVSAQAGKINSVVKGALLGIGAAAGFAAVQIGRDFARSMSVDAVSAASDFEESLNKARVVFGQAGDEVEEFAETAATSIGTASDQVLEMTATLGNLLSAAGVTGDRAAEMSTRMVTLAADFASFNNLAGGTEEALLAIRSGLVGEAEPLRRLGVLLNETRVRTKAMELGLASSTKAITEQDKVLARYHLILQDSGQAQGDFARTSDSLANRQRIVAAQFREAQIELGQKLLPLATDFFTLLSNVGIPALSELVNFLTMAAEGFGKLAGGVADALVEIFEFNKQARETASLIEQLQGVELPGYSESIRDMAEATGLTERQTRELVKQLEASGRFYEVNEALVDRNVDAFRDLEAQMRGGSMIGTRAFEEAMRDLAFAQRDQADASVEQAQALAITGQALLGLTAQALAARVAAGEIDLAEAFRIAGAAQELRGTAAVIENILAPAFMDLVPNIAGVTGQGQAWADAMADMGRTARGTGGAVAALNDELVNFQPPINIEAWRVWREAEEAIRAAKDAEDEFNDALGVQIMSLAEIQRLQAELGRQAAERTRTLAQARANVGQVDEFGNIVVGLGPNATGRLGGTRLLTPEQLREAQRTGGSVTTNYGTIQVILPNATDIDSALAEADLLAQG